MHKSASEYVQGYTIEAHFIDLGQQPLLTLFAGLYKEVKRRSRLEDELSYIRHCDNLDTFVRSCLKGGLHLTTYIAFGSW